MTKLPHLSRALKSSTHTQEEWPRSDEEAAGGSGVQANASHRRPFDSGFEFPPARAGHWVYLDYKEGGSSQWQRRSGSGRGGPLSGGRTRQFSAYSAAAAVAVVVVVVAGAAVFAPAAAALAETLR